MRLSAIATYPVKSCRGDSVDSAVVEPWGLAGDRRWMLVDPDGAAVTAREVNALLLAHPVITDSGLRVTAPHIEPLEVATPVVGTVPVQVWSSKLTATPAGPEADAWWSEVTGTAVRLVWLDDPTRRPISPGFAEPDDRVSFADDYPLLLTTESSLVALNDAVLERTQGQTGPMSMMRFRPNVVVSGAPAWAEDDWRRIRIGAASFRAVKGCARCVMTTVDPETAERAKEPTATLARTRRWDGSVWFGVNLIPDSPGTTIRIGDEVEVLDQVAPGGGPLRSAH